MFIAIALLLAQAPPAEAGDAPPSQCATEEHAAFDFWLGEWDVFGTADGARVGKSRIERINRGCAVLESWLPDSGSSGTSLNHYDAARGVWHQKWVGSAPYAVEFTGGAVDGGMVLTGLWPDMAGPGQPALVRMTYTLASDGSVRQLGEASSDHGLSWSPAFDFTYRPKGQANRGS